MSKEAVTVKGVRFSTRTATAVEHFDLFEITVKSRFGVVPQEITQEESFDYRCAFTHKAFSKEGILIGVFCRCIFTPNSHGWVRKSDFAPT